MVPLLSTDMRYHSRACSKIWLNWRPLMRALAVQVGFSVDDLRLLLTEVSGVLAAANTCSLVNFLRDLLHDPDAHPAIGMGKGKCVSEPEGNGSNQECGKHE